MRNIGKSDSGIKGLNTLEKVSHVLHMQAVWAQASSSYKDFIKNPPKHPDFCSCVTDVSKNEVLRALIHMAERIRGEELDSDEILNGIRTKRSPEPTKMYNTFEGGPNYEYFYSDYKGPKALLMRNKRSPDPRRLYNTFSGGPKYEYFYSDYTPSKLSISPRQKRKADPARMYNTFDGGPKYEYFYSDYKGPKALTMRHKRNAR